MTSLLHLRSGHAECAEDDRPERDDGRQHLRRLRPRAAVDGHAAGRRRGRAVVDHLQRLCGRFDDRPHDRAEGVHRCRPGGAVGTVPGRTGTGYLDSLGRRPKPKYGSARTTRTRSSSSARALTMPLGRVKFVADPFLSTDSFATAYGTTYTFNADGTPACAIRGTGVQPQTNVAAGLTGLTRPSRPVKCIRSARPARLPDQSGDRASARCRIAAEGSAQVRVTKQDTYSAIGRLLRSRTVTVASGGPGSPLHEEAAFGYDALGHLTSMTRYQNPGGHPANRVTTTWHYDSLGWMTKLEEPDDGAADPHVRQLGHGDRGAVVQRWQHRAVPDPGPPLHHPVRRARPVTHREDRTNGAVQSRDGQRLHLRRGSEHRDAAGHGDQRARPAHHGHVADQHVTYSYDAFGRSHRARCVHRHHRDAQQGVRGEARLPR